MRQTGVGQGVGEGGSLSLSDWETLFFTSVASSVCFRQHLRMKLGYCCPKGTFSLYHIPKYGESFEPLERWTWVGDLRL